MARAKNKSRKWTVREKGIAFVALLLVVGVSAFFIVGNPAWLDAFQGLFGDTYESRSGKNFLSDLPEYDAPTGALLEVHFIDVMQGDAIYVEFPDGKNMLIDAGDRQSAKTEALISYLDSEGVTTINYVMLTHADADHVGGMDDVINRYVVERVYQPRLSTTDVTTQVYEQFMTSVANEGCEVVYTEYTDTDSLLTISGAGYSMDIHCAPADYYDDEFDQSDSVMKNNCSPLCILEYAGRRIALTGDLSSNVLHNKGEDNAVINWSEEYFVDRATSNGIEADVDVLKVGHHGSEYSSSHEFLDLLKPEYAVICCGDADMSSTGNTHSHPTPEALSRLWQNGVKGVYRTDRHGHIVLSVGANGGMQFETENAWSISAFTAFDVRPTWNVAV